MPAKYFRRDLKIYYNHCEKTSPALEVVLACLMYLTYACTVAVLLFYILIFIFLRRNQSAKFSRDKIQTKTSVQMKLLRQSLFVFILYSGSNFCVLLLTNIGIGTRSIFEVAYAENLLNLSIAAVYPICFLSMSGEMKR
ncbi:hypothetical protein PFISCL1PPCAC_12666, partial [Pristionchus fissidentatus]